jgi:signal transduction histidine kinase
MEMCLNNPNNSYEVILRQISKKNEIVACKWEVKTITDAKNNFKEIQCMGFDITEQINSLEELKKLLELTSDQNQKLSSFAHIVSHNIRSHSANFSGILHLLNETNDTDEIRFFLDLLNKSANQLDQTIRNLNDVLSVNVRLETHFQSRFLLNEIENTLQILSGDINKHNVNVEINIDSAIMIDVVPAYLDSILINLISNAIKFRSQDRQLNISFNTSSEGQFQVFTIRDNGQGIDLDRYGHKIFGLYNTFHENTDSKGFGLYITKTQIESMGGQISIDSEVGIGTTFKVYFKQTNIEA